MYNFPGTNPGLVSISFELTTQWLITTTQSRISLSRVRLKYVTISTVLSTFHALLNEMEMKDSDTKLKKLLLHYSRTCLFVYRILAFLLDLHRENTIPTICLTLYFTSLQAYLRKCIEIRELPSLFK